jgi:NAD(P)-dependent dehydrogenase (short-subunit alcohol dehydrogenase family)
MDTTAIVTGAGRGLGRAVATALVGTGTRVVGVARGSRDLAALAAELGDAFVPVTGDATDPALAEALIAEHRPGTLVLAAGAVPVSRPLPEHTWETFSTHWHSDVRHVFEWTRAALLAPLPPGSRVVAFSSGAAVHGSPASGGYAGAKATVRFLSAYAAAESERAALGITFGCLLPAMTPAGGVGAAGVAAYARRQGTDPDTFLAGMGPTLTGAQVADAVLAVADKGGPWLLTPAGLTPA